MAHADNRAFWQYYLDRAEGCPPCIVNNATQPPSCTKVTESPLPCACRPRTKGRTWRQKFGGTNKSWLVGEIFFTGLFLFLSGWLITHRDKPPGNVQSAAARAGADSGKTALPRP